MRRHPQVVRRLIQPIDPNRMTFLRSFTQEVESEAYQRVYTSQIFLCLVELEIITFNAMNPLKIISTWLRAQTDHIDVDIIITE